ncbi:MAG: phage tail assembly protein [Bryobacterales bacterium]|nr:phage tail assembly protein [Bryobacterales bacterium]MDE0296360.1 phage tail assembly protein [Bryobacterales bacterium]
MTTIKLKHPVKADGAEVAEVTMRAPKVRDMIAADKGGGSDAERELRMFANLCEITPRIIEELHLVDYKAMQGAYLDFLS